MILFVLLRMSNLSLIQFHKSDMKDDICTHLCYDLVISLIDVKFLTHSLTLRTEHLKCGTRGEFDDV